MLEAAGLLEGANLYDFENTQVVHHLNQALRANVMFKRDIDYIVKDGKVVIIDEFTGRMMDGRRWSDGLHQAVEAKEGVQIEPENQTLASITFQNYFRMYPKLVGHDRHRRDRGGRILRHLQDERRHDPDQRAGAADRRGRRVLQEHRTTSSARSPRRSARRPSSGQPVLVGTVSIEKSELLSRIPQRRKACEHEVLNARYHEQEAHIVAQAGRLGAVTIATNMAGRGTDIQLGGNLEFRIARRARRAWRGTPERDAAIERIKAGDRGGEGSGARRRRPVRARHRAAREPPHRQPAARPFGPAGRSRPQPLLSQPRRRSAAHLRPADDVRAR